MKSICWLSAWGLFCFLPVALRAADLAPLGLAWEKNYLTIRGDFPGKEIRIHYLEAHCRPGSTDRDWRETVIRHTAEMLSQSEDGRVIKLRDTLADGVVVEHTITASADEVDFRLSAHNPTDKASEAHWAQPCIRVEKFTGTTNADARELVPQYARKCFLFIDGNLQRLPTTPWADKARYMPGQVYAPKHVDRNDVNPRPLSSLVPSNGLCGCFSADEKQIMAVAWEPYQEIFQGVIACMHNDFALAAWRRARPRKSAGSCTLCPRMCQRWWRGSRRISRNRQGNKTPRRLVVVPFRIRRSDCLLL